MDKKSIYKQILIGLVLLLGNYLVLYCAQSLLNDYPYYFLKTVLLLVLYWLVLMSIWSLALFFIKEKMIIFLVVIISAALSTLLYRFNIYFIIAQLILILFSLTAYSYVQRDLKSRIKITPDLTLLPGLKKMIFPTILILTVVFYLSPQSVNPKIFFPDWLKSRVCQIQIPSSPYNLCQIPDLLENRFFNMFIPGINPNSTIDDLVDDSLAQSLNLSGGKDQFRQEVKPTMSPEKIDSTRAQLIQSLGLDANQITGSTQLKDSKVISSLIKKRLGDVGQSESLLKLIYSLLFLEISMFLAKIFLPLSLTIFWIFYQLMLKTKFIYIEKTPTEMEKIII